MQINANKSLHSLDDYIKYSVIYLVHAIMYLITKCFAFDLVNQQKYIFKYKKILLYLTVGRTGPNQLSKTFY